MRVKARRFHPSDSRLCQPRRKPSPATQAQICSRGWSESRLPSATWGKAWMHFCKWQLPASQTAPGLHLCPDWILGWWRRLEPEERGRRTIRWGTSPPKGKGLKSFASLQLAVRILGALRREKFSANLCKSYEQKLHQSSPACSNKRSSTAVR